MSHARRMLFWAALPLAAPQAIRLRRRAPRFAVARGPLSGSVGEGPTLRLAGVGDSVIAGVGAGTTDRAMVARASAGLADRLRCRVAWRAAGIVGADADSVRRDLVPAVPKSGVDLWLVSTGVNDVTSLKRSARWRADLDALLAALSAHSPGSVTVTLGVPPMGTFPLLPWPLRALLGLRSEEFDAVAAEVARHRGALHSPYARALRPEQFSADGYHPSPEGHADIARAVTDLAVKVFRDRAPADAGGSGGLDIGVRPGYSCPGKSVKHYGRD